MALNRYGIREQTQAKTDLEVHVEEIRILGCTVLPPCFSEEQLQDWRQHLDNLLEQQTTEAGGREVLSRIGEADLVRAPLVSDHSFLGIAANDKVIAIVGALLGDYFILTQQNGILNRPQAGPHHQTAYHRDLPYQHFVSSRPIGVNALLCLDPFEVETGSTLVLPASHKIEAFPSDRYVAKMEQPITASPGSYILMDSMLYHRAGVNRSNRMRRGVNNAYALPIIKQQIALPAMLGGRWRDDPFLARLLGYESDPPQSIREYLARRIDRVPPTKTT
jgi:ectoine hydroxylase-related dioxygenase (phytanoyl-CoA dioxygenase family)